MKVFWVVAYHRYEPSGGMNDVLQTFATLAEAESYAATVTDYHEVEIHDVRGMLGVSP